MLTAPYPASGKPNPFTSPESSAGSCEASQGQNQSQAASGEVEKTRRKEPSCPRADTATSGGYFIFCLIVFGVFFKFFISKD